MLSQIPAAYQRPLAFGVPVLCLLLAALLIVPRYRALRADEDELARTQKSVREKKALIEAALREPTPPPVAYLPADRDEPVLFLRQLSQLAAACGVKFTSVTTVAPETPTGEATASANGTGDAGGTNTPQAGLPTGTSPVALQITVIGPYASHLRFFERLESYPRLISVTNVTMDASQHPRMTSLFRLTRYIGPPSAVAPAPAAPPSPARGT